MYFCAPCLIGVKFGGLNPVSFIRLIASSPLTWGQGSHSHLITGAHSLSGSLPCPKMSKLGRNLSPFTQQILACLGGLNVTRHSSVLQSFRHLQLMINCEWWEIKSSKASCLPRSAKWLWWIQAANFPVLLASLPSVIKGSYKWYGNLSSSIYFQRTLSPETFIFKLIVRFVVLMI